MTAAPPLARVRVLDCSQFIPGPEAARILGDLGAEVLKIEPPGGEPMRRLGPVDADGLSLWYKLMNGGKTVLELDLKSKDGGDAFSALLAAADILVESYRPGVLARLGFDRARLTALNPGLVHVALSGWGQTGPYADRVGHDINYMALAGGLAASGTGETPTIAYPPTADHASALQAALAACAALIRRGRDGSGAFIDVSLAETVLAWQSIPLTMAARGEGRRARGMLNGGAAYYQIYRTRDGAFVTLGAVEEKFWENFCAAVGRPDWVVRHADPFPQTALIAAVAALFASRDAAAWSALLDKVPCCFHPVVPAAAVPDHPQIAARGLVARDGGGLVEVLFPAHIDGAPPRRRQPLRSIDVAEAIARWR